MSRKIIQISAVSPGSNGRQFFHPAALALADDGTVWCAGYNPVEEQFDPWQKLRDLPQTDQEALDVLAEHKKALVEPQFSLADAWRKRIAGIRSLFGLGNRG
ncbi:MULTISPECIES: RCC1 domain-containing protein [Pseudomonadaceae]|uniref:RCC1 domain-containing protein n=1 Tax=Pseudomonadaceae TaxID=135621 RepID=UPI001ADA5E62|nr:MULTISPECIES: RCC1 domain-containing protein [Pseudomonas aeruginosa group]MBO8337187.1 hypothetical protein [Pseudomonas aeruginosa]BDC78420.1 hypothetical protein MRCP2_p1550 [Pseudomonas alcaligenes]HCF4080784.1 hypothetical protein [Pseudomonas aeruginosa]